MVPLQGIVPAICVVDMLCTAAYVLLDAAGSNSLGRPPVAAPADGFDG